MALQIAFGPAYHSRPNGSAAEIRSARRMLFTKSGEDAESDEALVKEWALA
jgi:hypothetical protein